MLSNFWWVSFFPITNTEGAQLTEYSGDKNEDVTKVVGEIDDESLNEDLEKKASTFL